ncbi:hypothetical protein D3C71_1252210 [compost metagenome]
MGQLRPRGHGNEVLGHQALQLLQCVRCGFGGVFGVLDLAGGGCVFSEDGGGQARHLIGDQREAPPALFNAAFEGNFVGGQRVEQKGPVQRHVDDLGAQLFLCTQGHVGHGHLLQVGDVFFEVLEGVLDLQRKQAAQARAVFGGGDFGLVKNLDGHSVAAVDERRKADQRLPGLFDLHQLGQLAKRPGGVALACGGRWGDARRFRGGGRCPLYS